jgi:hypothetical protein
MGHGFTVCPCGQGLQALLTCFYRTGPVLVCSVNNIEPLGVPDRTGHLHSVRHRLSRSKPKRRNNFYCF